METKTKSRVQELIDELLNEIDLDSDLNPQRDRVMVKEIKESQSSVLWVPEEGKANKGVVVAVGPGHYSPQGVRIPIELEPGDVVVFNKHVGEIMEFNEETVRLIKASDILLRVR